MLSYQNALFLPNSRNIGANRQLEKQFENHKKALKTTKSSLGSLKAPHPHIDYVTQKRKNKSRNNSLQSSFTNPEPSYITINGLSHQGFSFPVMTKKNKRQDEFIRNEHEKRCRLLKEKVRNVGKSVQERKKKSYDPRAKPVYLIRPPTQMKTPALDTFDMQVSNDVWRSTYKPLGKLTQLADQKVQESFCFDAGSLYESTIRREVNNKIRDWHRPKDLEPPKAKVVKVKIAQNFEEDHFGEQFDYNYGGTYDYTNHYNNHHPYEEHDDFEEGYEEEL